MYVLIPMLQTLVYKLSEGHLIVASENYRTHFERGWVECMHASKLAIGRQTYIDARVFIMIAFRGHITQAAIGTRVESPPPPASALERLL